MSFIRSLVRRQRSLLLQHRQHVSTYEAAALRRKAIESHGAPRSISEIPDHWDHVPSSGSFKKKSKKKQQDTSSSSSNIPVLIRPIGCTRHVFLMDPFLTAAQMEGLAYRIRTLTKNEALNSVLISNDTSTTLGNEVTPGLPRMLLDRDYPYLRCESVDDGFSPEPGKTYHVAGGYDPLAVFASGQHKNAEAVESLLTHLSELALATRGDVRSTKIPTIAVPDGHFNDGGFALCGMPSYVLATRETSFRIQRPSQGLSLDPVGLSYILPRLGREFQQPAAEYEGCGMILALMGYEADADDMMETGLATHYIDSTHALGLLEHTLSELRPWNQQQLIKEPLRMMGDREAVRDHNADFRNVSVAETIHSFSSYRADGLDVWSYRDEDAYAIESDPSLDLDHIPWHQARSSDLVNYAATFSDIFKTERTLPGILERFREVAAQEPNDPEDQEAHEVAKEFCRCLEQQSPLAVSVIFRLLKEGSKGLETLHSCMAREKRVQTKLFGMDDFENWAKHASTSKEPFKGWKHKQIAHVTDDEVTEIVDGNPFELFGRPVGTSKV